MHVHALPHSHPHSHTSLIAVCLICRTGLSKASLAEVTEGGDTLLRLSGKKRALPDDDAADSGSRKCIAITGIRHHTCTGISASRGADVHTAGAGASDETSEDISSASALLRSQNAARSLTSSQLAEALRPEFERNKSRWKLPDVRDKVLQYDAGVF